MQSLWYKLNNKKNFKYEKRYYKKIHLTLSNDTGYF